MDYVLAFFAGALLCNAIPHIVSGLRGDLFPSPFSKPPGVGNSGPLVNFFWGAGNLIAGAMLAFEFARELGYMGCGLLAAGFVVGGAALANHFGKVRRQG